MRIARVSLVLLALAGCGKKSHRPDAGPAVPAVGAVDLAAVPDGPLLVLTPSATTLDGTTVTPADLAHAAADLAKHAPGTLRIAADPDTPFPALVAAIDAVKLAYPTLAILARKGDHDGCVLYTPPTAPLAPETTLEITLLPGGVVVSQMPVEPEQLHVELEDARKHGALGARLTAEPKLTAAAAVPALAVIRESFDDVVLISP